MDQGVATALHTDHYELTMVASALESGVATRDSVFEVFTRRLPAGRAYGVVAGMNRLIEAIGNFRFSDEVIEHLVSAGVVSHGPMTEWLANYHFRGDVTGYADGEPDQYRIEQVMLETAWQSGGFSWQQEFHWKKVTDRGNMQSQRLSGGYMQAGYFFHE